MSSLDAPSGIVDKLEAHSYWLQNKAMTLPYDATIAGELLIVSEALACIREQQAALAEARELLHEGLETAGVIEADWSKLDRKFVAKLDAVLAKYALEPK